MDSEFFDVVIVGAGLSGIGAAWHLQHKCPSKRYLILESRDTMGGTWDLFRYPGIRSDSDMFTLGYKFKPWNSNNAMADGTSILNYVKETATENDIIKNIRYGNRLISASWSSEKAIWTLTIKCQQTKTTTEVQCQFLLMCAGYYRYDTGYSPEFKGQDRFHGTLIHPQHWPESLDYSNKKIIVIGSGATAITLVPELAKKARHVTMLQRSPSYILSLPAKDKIASILRKVLPQKWVYFIIRKKNIARQQYLYRLTRTHPEKIKSYISKMAQKALGQNYDINTHFSPSYSPWDQRLCFIPNNDFFKSIKSSNATVLTGQIDCFTETGIQLQSGENIEADIIVTATGFNLEILGGTQFSKDGNSIDFAKTYTYKGIMYSSVPNMASIFGYINASWTLHVDLIAEYVCKLINHMDSTETQQCTPQLREVDKNMSTRPWIEEFSSGYIQRAIHLFPKQGSHEPWLNTQDYNKDKESLKTSPIDDGILIFSNKKEVTE